MRGERGDEGYDRDGFHYQNWRSKHRSSSPIERYNGGEGPYAREADNGGDQGGWTWVSRRRRKASRPDWDDMDDSRQGYGHTGRFPFQADERRDFGYRQGFGDRDRYRDELYVRRGATSRIRAQNDYQDNNGQFRGRSSSRHGNRFSSRDKNKSQMTISQADSSSAVFYISNIPDHLLFVDLKKGIEVCGILDDIYISRYRNYYGQRFGFVKFAKVRDVLKLKKALNNVYFWEFKLFANVAKYDRFIKNKYDEGAGAGVVKEDREGEKIVRLGEEKGGVWRRKELEKVKEEAVRSEIERERGKVSGGEVAEEVEGAVRVLPVKEGGKDDVEIEIENTAKAKEEVVERVVSWTYQSLQEDILWAAQCYMAKIKFGFQFRVVQQTLVDAGLAAITLIPLGGENVVLRANDQADIQEVLNNAADFLANFLEDIKPWARDTAQMSVRGAWLRVYGIPLHAWNTIFMAEVAETQGKILLIDEVTVNKERLDFARILVSTPLMEVINGTCQVLIDNVMTELRIIEEAGSKLAEDACLAELDDDNKSFCSAHTGMQEEEPLIEEFVQQLQADWEKQESLQAKTESDTVNQVSPPFGNLEPKDSGDKNSNEAFGNYETKVPVVKKNEASFGTHEANVTGKKKSNSSFGKCETKGPGSKKINRPFGNCEPKVPVKQNISLKQPSTSKKTEELGPNSGAETSKRPAKKKILIPSAYGIRRMARLSETERNNLIRALKIAKRQQSNTSVEGSKCKNCTSLSAGSGSSNGPINSQDWNNYVALHNKESQVQSDIKDIGEKLGVRCQNSFEVLAGGRGGGRGKGGVRRK